ncbi:MAG: transglycosylase SLT domain-containing protein [Candidatus Accumulibacter sp. UW25]|jgi:hypothetical protein
MTNDTKSRRVIDDPTWDDYSGGLEKSRGLKSGLLTAIALRETRGGHPDIISKTSSAGAKGMFQFMDGTAKQYNVDVTSAGDSARGAADFLQDLSKKYGDHLLASAAYNWGPGNLDRAIKKAKAAGHDGSIESLVNGNYLPQETRDYVINLDKDLTNKSKGSTIDAKQKQAITDSVKQGKNSWFIVEKLRDDPIVQKLKAEGKTDDQIVAAISSEPGTVQRYQESAQESTDRGFFDNMILGAGKAAQNGFDNVKILADQYLGDGKTAAALRADRIQRDAQPEQQQLDQSSGGRMGKFLPGGIVAGMTGGTSLLGQAAAFGGMGAISGAMEPADTLSERGLNGLKEGAIDAASAVLPFAALKGALLGTRRVVQGNKATRDAAQSAFDEASFQKIPVSASGISEKYADTLSSGSGRSLMQKVNETINGKVAKELGIPDFKGPINTEMVMAAEQAIKPGLDLASKITQIDLNKSSAALLHLHDIVQGSSNSLLTGIAQKSQVRSYAERLLNKAKTGQTVTGKELQELNSVLKDNLRSAELSSVEKQATGKLVNALNSIIEGQMNTVDRAAFKAANRQWAHLAAVKQMVLKSGNSGEVTPTQMIQAIKSGAFKSQFLRDGAPFQSTLEHLAQHYGVGKQAIEPSGISRLVKQGSGPAIALMLHGLPAAVGAGALGLAGQSARNALANSTNKTIVRLLTGAHEGASQPSRGFGMAMGNFAARNNGPLPSGPNWPAPPATNVLAKMLGLQAATQPSKAKSVGKQLTPSQVAVRNQLLRARRTTNRRKPHNQS